MNRNNRRFIIGGIVATLAVIAYIQYAEPRSEAPGDHQTGTPLVEVKVPELSGTATVGKALFDANCAACHGYDAAGKNGLGPPLVHKIYEPGHHGDMAFQLAVKNGVRAHHWRFGNMPPVEGVTQSDVDKIVAYIRALQRENGIF